MSWQSLPVGFQDAIRVCRKLSIPYLWIDSLCISQDSVADWATESVKMTDVYTNAYIVLAHSSAWNSTHSVLAERAPSPALGLSRNNAGIHLRHLRDPNLKRFYRLFETNFSTEYTRDFFTTTYGISTLGSRGWTFQERLLASRLVYFTACQLVWQCRSQNMVESSADSSVALSADVLMARTEDCAFEGLGLEVVPNNFSSPALATVAWQAVTSVYSDMLLTYETDRLVALAGLAQRFKDFVGGEYAAGLWRNWLPLLLTWQSYFITARRPKVYRAPTWSWAAIEGRIYYSFLAIDDHFISTVKSIRGLEILDICVQTYDGNEFSPLIGARLHVRGLCTQLAYRDGTDRSFDPSSIYCEGNWGKETKWDLDVNDEFKPGHVKDGQNIEPGMQFAHEEGTFLAIQVMMRTRKRNWDFSTPETKDANVFCLLLKEVHGNTGIYSRFGSLRAKDTILAELGTWEERELVLI